MPRRWSLRTRLTAIAVAGLIACLLVTGITAERLPYADLTALGRRDLQARTQLTAAMGPASIAADGRLVMGTTVLDGNAALVEHLHTIAGTDTAAVVKGDVRLLATVRRADGSPAVGDSLPAGPLRCFPAASSPPAWPSSAGSR